MSLEEYRNDMAMCCRCSICKFIPMERIKNQKHSYICPSIARYNFHSYSGGGRMGIGSAILDKRIGNSDKFLDVVYNCQMCGGCDISCKYAMDMEVLEPINEIRIKCVEDGQTLPALDKVVEQLADYGTMFNRSNIRRGQWAKGVGVRNIFEQRAQVLFHAGCRTCYNKDLWEVARTTVILLQKAGVDIGIAGDDEPCCGARAYQMGYKAQFLKQAEKTIGLIKKSGAEIIVTGCAECYHGFKVLYDKFNLRGNLRVMHSTEYLAELIETGKIKPSKKVLATVTYHDPCHLGRQGEPYIHWNGKELHNNHIRLFDPPKEFRRGTGGVYEPPRKVLKSIPGLKLVEMDRTKEYSWCCGSGGGVRESNPEFARWTAIQRIKEAESTGAEAIVTACPGCEQSLTEAISNNGSKLKIYDVVQLIDQAI